MDASSQEANSQGPKVLLYDQKKSYTSGFCRVYNEGTKEYDDLDLDSHFDAIDAKGLVEKYFSLDKLNKADEKRKNQQENFLYSSGMNTARNNDELENDFGAAMPQLNKGSTEQIQLAEEASKVARKLNVTFANPRFIDSSPFLRRRFGRFARKISPNNCLEGLTVAFLPIGADYKVLEHMDEGNEHLLEPAPKVYRTNLDGKLTSIIAYSSPTVTR